MYMHVGLHASVFPVCACVRSCACVRLCPCVRVRACAYVRACVRASMPACLYGNLRGQINVVYISRMFSGSNYESSCYRLNSG